MLQSMETAMWGRWEMTEESIEIAKTKAGLAGNNTVKIVEIPKRGLFNAGAFVPKLFSIESPAPEDETLRMIRFRLDHNGRALPIVPLEDAELWKNSVP